MSNNAGIKIALGLRLLEFVWLAVIVVMLGRIITYVVPVATPVTVDQGSLFEMIQKYKYNTSGYRYTESFYLCGVADKRINDIKTDFNHQGLIDMTDQMFDETRFTTFNENMVREVYTDQAAFDAWMASSGHKKTLDDDFTHTCLRCSNNLCVQEFAK